MLKGFKDTKVKIHLLGTQDLRTLNSRRKFQGLFDIGVMSLHSADKISPDLTKMFKDKARVHCESADYLIVMKPEQREEFRAKANALPGMAKEFLTDETSVLKTAKESLKQVRNYRDAALREDCGGREGRSQEGI